MKIVFLDSATTVGKDLLLDSLSELGDFKAYDRTPSIQVMERAKDAEILIVNKVIVDPKLIDHCPNLKYIVVGATGYNNVDTSYAAKKNIPVSNVRGYSTEGVVQHVFALLLRGLNHISHYNQEVNNQRWSEHPDFCFYDHSIRELNGKTLGIYGLGTIGGRVTQVAQAFGMKTIAYHRNPHKLIHPEARLVSAEDLLNNSDVLTLHAPLNAESSNFINNKSLKKMKKGAILINTGRGGLVDEEALAEALRDNHVSFAGIDTLSEEPPVSGSPLINLSNCYITPHIAWAGFESRQRLLKGVEENISSFLNGRIMNQVNG